MNNLLLLPGAQKAKKQLCLSALFLSGLLGAQNVNPFTGSFSYNLPLFTIPSNRGNGVSLNASYGAGIQVNQSSSEIGLGWQLNAEAAIYRSVSGIPDDTKSHTYYPLPSTNAIVNAQGALYPDPNGSTNDFDFTTVKAGLDTTEFTFPGFDSYAVYSPGGSGKLQLSYFNFYGYESASMGSSQPRKLVPAQSLVPGGTAYYRKPQFHFENDFSDTLVSRHYTAQINGGTPFRIPTDVLSGPGYSNTADPFIGQHQTGSGVINQNFDPTSGRLATSNFVEYFTNKEIDDASSMGFSGAGALDDFIDYKATHARGTSDFPEYGIGAFRITNANGVTYHYSLPVYQIEQTSYYFPLDQDYTLISGLNIVDIPDGPGYEQRSHPTSQNVMIKDQSFNKIAVKWLLTAITGADYVDNGNHYPDTADQGYWMRYDYHLWNGRFASRIPHYGYEFQFSPDSKSQSYPSFFPTSAPPNDPYKLSGLSGSVSLKKTELYHLNKIRSSSHSAIFIRDIRNDEKGADTTVDACTAFAPNLALKRIILFKNEHLDSITNAHPTIAFNPSNYSVFDFFTTQNTGNLFNEPWFQAQYNNLKHCILKHIAFDQDYSLCHNYHGNIEVNWAACDALRSPADVENNLSTGTYSISGKLTLNRIVTYDFQDGKVIPSTLYDYGKASPLSNPDYNPRKVDYWGFYKSDATQNGWSGYTTFLSAANTKAWSLLKITDPLGGITEMEYESNTYNRVLDNEAPGGIRGPAFIYRIKQANDFFSTWDLTMEEGNTSGNALTEFLSLNASTVQPILCIPYFQQISSADWNQVLYAPPGSPLPHDAVNGFIFGTGTFSINTGTGSTDNLILTSTLTPVSPISHRNAWNQDPLSRKYNSSVSSFAYPTINTYTNTTSFSYSGNGFLMYEMPVGYMAHGNGIRLKKLKTRNRFSISNETYVTEYTYENGVATDEMDRFEHQVLKTGSAGGALRYGFLQPKNLGKFKMVPYIGYSKVAAKNLGRINTANGRSETFYVTDPADFNSAFSQNYTIQGVSTTTSSGATLYIHNLNECVNIFSNIFGQVKEMRTYDKNNNMLQRTVNEFELTEQGATTENFYFHDPLYGLDYPAVYNGAGSYSSANSHTVNIFRNLPVTIKKTTVHRMGLKEVTEMLARDEITGEPASMLAEGENGTSVISFKKPAYQYYQNLEGLDFTSAQLRKKFTMSAVMYNYSNIDSVFTTTGGSSSSFLNASYQLYSKIMRQRQYNVSTGLLAVNQYTLPQYVNSRSFIFNAGSGSGDVYGLLDKSNLYSNALSPSSMTTTLFWEPVSTTNWKLIYEHTLIDDFKNVLETRDANNRFNAMRFGYNGYYRTASATNCNYASFTFAGFETPPATIAASGFATVDGDVIVKSSNTFMRNTDIVNGAPLLPHSGIGCVLVAADPVTFTTASQQSPGGSLEIGLQSGRIYRASVWTHTTNLNNARLEVIMTGTCFSGPPNFVVVPTTATHVATAASNSITSMGNWVLLQMDFEVPQNFSTNTLGQFSIQLKSANSGTVYFDDLVFHPVESDFSASVYNPRNGRVMSLINGNGLATNFTYDAAGRTLEVWKEIPGSGYKLTKKHSYNYARGAAN